MSAHPKRQGWPVKIRKLMAEPGVFELEVTVIPDSEDDFFAFVECLRGCDFILQTVDKPNAKC